MAGFEGSVDAEPHVAFMREDKEKAVLPSIKLTLRKPAAAKRPQAFSCIAAHRQAQVSAILPGG